VNRVDLSVTVEATEVGIIQIVGGLQVLTVNNSDQFFGRLTRGENQTANGSDDDLADIDRGKHHRRRHVAGIVHPGRIPRPHLLSN
jgi:hypothetical protein